MACRLIMWWLTFPCHPSILPGSACQGKPTAAPLPILAHSTSPPPSCSARQFVGVKTVSPELLLIEERQATSQAADADHSTVCVWYCLNGSILQCPSLHAVIASRLVSLSEAHFVGSGCLWKPC